MRKVSIVSITRELGKQHNMEKEAHALTMSSYVQCEANDQWSSTERVLKSPFLYCWLSFKKNEAEELCLSQLEIATRRSTSKSKQRKEIKPLVVGTGK